MEASPLAISLAHYRLHSLSHRERAGERGSKKSLCQPFKNSPLPKWFVYAQTRKDTAHDYSGEKTESEAHHNGIEVEGQEADNEWRRSEYEWTQWTGWTD